MPKQTWFIASILTALIIIGIVSYSAHQRQVELEKITKELSEVKSSSDKAAAETKTLSEELAASRKQIELLQKEKEEAASSQKSLEQKMREALESRDVTISELQGKLTVNILDRILFDSGEAVLKPEGQQVLTKLADVLKQYPNRQIHVIGHTDNVPIRWTSTGRFASNWELSTARATSAVRFLAENSGINPQQLGIVGYGEYHPVADNKTAEGRAKNRRIAIVILPDVLAKIESLTNNLTTLVAPISTNAPLSAADTNSVSTNAPTGK